MTGLLQGRTAIVTGAASRRGLGRATATLLAAHGARVAILDIDGEAAAAAASDLGDSHMGLACDVTDKDACAAAADTCLARWGQVDVLVNNAGVSEPLKLMEIAPHNYERVTGVNLGGTLFMSQAVVPAMRDRARGSIINIASVSGQRGGGIFGGPHYAAAKAGILGLTKAMARELAGDGVRVNAICPGLIDTDITTGMPDSQRRDLIAAIPMGRIGVPADVAGCVLFLASDLSAYCTGTEVDVNGGSHIH
ncbi:MAG: SDR family NAD(P)-dependent oxidoreductase [Pseudomonadota bacterium]